MKIIIGALTIVLVVLAQMSIAYPSTPTSVASLVSPGQQVPLPFKRSGHPLKYTGVCLSGGEFYQPQAGKTPVYGTNFIYPSDQEFAYFAARGVNIVRIPFLWETLQPSLDQPVVPTELARLESVVKQATVRRLTVLLDPHDYERYYGKLIGSPDVSDAAFASFWAQVGAAFKDNNRVWFGLINEPHDAPVSQWLASAQAAIDAIRKTGARNMILVPGEGYTGAHSWLDTGSDKLLEINDPESNYQFEVHQYLDSDFSGSHPDAISATVGVDRLKTFTEWCRSHHKRAFLGEFAAAAGDENHLAIDNMLNFMEANRDVWSGFTWWAAGPWWGDYMFTLEPTKDGHDRPQLLYLTEHLHGI